ncbi:MAG: ABC transporter ATP-binding protein [Clostridiaceae bacterium]|nr:ABC transporter ATP-binding protein [Clostridiaceae bacterium]
MLTLTNLTHTYPRASRPALDDVTLTLTPGIYGILGPNGSGKSTMMNIITDTLTPTTGSVAWDGTDIRKLGAEYRRLVGYSPQHQGLYDDFTANRFLWYMAALKGMRKPDAARQIDTLLRLVNLRDDAHKRLGAFSGGMKQRVLIAQALLDDPKILILDEPTAGLDPRERIRIRNFLSEIAHDKIVLLATHVVSDVECIAGTVVLLKKGKILAASPAHSLLREIDGRVFTLDIVAGEVHELSGYTVSNLAVSGENRIEARIVLTDGMDAPEGAKPVRPTLEDVYLYHFGSGDAT